MSTGIKEFTELLRAASAVTVEYLAAVKDGDFGFIDKLKFVGLYPTIAAGIKGVGKVPGELRDLDPVEKDALVAEIRESLIRTGKFTHREADIAERVLSLAYHNVREISDMISLPPTALPVE